MDGLALGPGGAVIRWTELPGDGGDGGDDGDDPAVVFLHGMGGMCSVHFGPAAARTSRRSLLIDLFGHGISDRPADFSYSLEEHADAVAAVVSSASTGPVHVVGHSMGGSIAIVLAARHPGLVRSLLLVEPNLDPGVLDPAVLGSRGLAAQSEAAFLDGGYEALLAAADPGWRATLRLTDALALHRSAVHLVEGSSPSMRELLVGLKIPRTHVSGEQGDADPIEGLAPAGVELVTVPDAGHDVMLGQPEAFGVVLERFLQQGGG